MSQELSVPPDAVARMKMLVSADTHKAPQSEAKKKVAARNSVVTTDSQEAQVGTTQKPSE